MTNKYFHHDDLITVFEVINHALPVSKKSGKAHANGGEVPVPIVPILMESNFHWYEGLPVKISIS